jgi:hypothetical protein
MHYWGVLLCMLFLGSALHAATDGTLYGELLSAPESSHGKLVVFLEGPNGTVRSVVITQAVAEYDGSATPEQRLVPAGRALLPGTDVRVTAHMDAESGEWTASEVVVIPNHAARFDEDYSYDGRGPARVRTVPAPSSSLRTI